METNLKAFMIPKNKEAETITLPGIDRYKGEDGQPIPFILRRLSRQEQSDIRELYHTKELVKDKNGRPLINGNRVVYDEDTDQMGLTRELMVKCFVQPDMTKEEMRKYYGVNTNVELPDILFPTSEDWNYANRCVMIACGLLDKETEDKIIETVKN